MDKDKVLGLAKLARIAMSDTEAEKLSNEFEAILRYVGEVKSMAYDKHTATNDLVLKNVLREDNDPHEPGIYTEQILSQAPAREGSYLKVKKIL